MEKITYEYGAVSSRFSCEAKNKLTAYATMVAHYDSQANLLVIYKPKEAEKDSWMCFNGRISERLDKLFGGAGSFDDYFKNNIEEIKECYKSIKRIC